MTTLRNLLAGLLLAMAFGCTGGSGGGGGGTPPPPPATKLTYTDPGDSTQWRLTRNAASTATHLVLDVSAPATASGRGVTLVLSCDPKVSWKAVDGAAYVKNLAYSGSLVQKGSPQGQDLRVLLSQKPGTAVAYAGAPVLSVALDLVGGSLPGSLSLSAAQGAHLGTAAAPEAVTVAVGTLKAE